MAGAARSALRSSARLNTTAGGAEARRGAEAGEGAAAAERAREAAAAAARRRERAAERAREVEDSPHVLREKCRLLARAVRNAKHLVVYTGAGISTAADIPDYRGPHGVWTRLQRGEAVGRVEVARAQPTLTHMALTALWARGTLKFVVSQNCDGLHVRAGLPRRALAELHGNMFAERCAACRRVYLRAFDTTERTARHAHGTRRLCHACGAELHDTIVHFGERGRAAWPLNWAGALRHAAAADVVLCLGSSLKVLRRYPRLWRMQRAPHARPALYIVNLQWTPKDAAAALKINARCDAVMAQVARRLRLAVPRYSPRRDPLLAHAEPLAPAEAHTTRRAALRAPSASPPPPAAPSPPASPSASDSDEELPLRRLAERIRAPPAPPPPPPTRPAAPPPPPPGLLHAFQVRLASGDATILLRAQDAPSVPAPPPPPRPPPRSPPPPAAGARPATCASSACAARAPAPAPAAPARLANGHHPPPPAAANGRWPPAAAAPAAVNGDADHKWPVKCEPDQECYVRPDTENKAVKVESENKLVKLEPDNKAVKLDPDGGAAVKSESDEGEAGAGEEASALAAAIIARAVLLCRASLYSGLHTILAPPPPPRPPPRAPPRPPPPPAECAWCARVLGARRCRWYGPPAGEGAARVWRRVRGRRYLCACCPAPGGGGGGARRAGGDGGWYGKGYRKGRRPRRR